MTAIGTVPTGNSEVSAASIGGIRRSPLPAAANSLRLRQQNRGPGFIREPSAKSLASGKKRAWPPATGPKIPPALARQDATVALLQTLPRRAARDALRSLRGRILRTELYALDGSALEPRPYIVAEYTYGIREESPPDESQQDRIRVFFPHLTSERTTNWERGFEPMTRLQFSDDYQMPTGSLNRQSAWLFHAAATIARTRLPRSRISPLRPAPVTPTVMTTTASSSTVSRWARVFRS